MNNACGYKHVAIKFRSVFSKALDLPNNDDD